MKPYEKPTISTHHKSVSIMEVRCPTCGNFIICYSFSWVADGCGYSACPKCGTPKREDCFYNQLIHARMLELRTYSIQFCGDCPHLKDRPERTTCFPTHKFKDCKAEEYMININKRSVK
jgi:hypothetical protein